MGVMATVTGPYAESLRLPATLAAPGLARRRVVLACDGLDDDARSTAELLTSELVANAVLHPDGGAGREPEILLHIRRTDQLLRVEVHDHDPTPPVAPNSPASLRDSGMGLHLVNELSSAWGHEPIPDQQGKAVWFELRLG